MFCSTITGYNVNFFHYSHMIFVVHHWFQRMYFLVWHTDFMLWKPSNGGQRVFSKRKDITCNLYQLDGLKTWIFQTLNTLWLTWGLQGSSGYHVEKEPSITLFNIIYKKFRTMVIFSADIIGQEVSKCFRYLFSFTNILVFLGLYMQYMY